MHVQSYACNTVKSYRMLVMIVRCDAHSVLTWRCRCPLTRRCRFLSLTCRVGLTYGRWENVDLYGFVHLDQAHVAWTEYVARLQSQNENAQSQEEQDRCAQGRCKMFRKHRHEKIPRPPIAMKEPVCPLLPFSKLGHPQLYHSCLPSKSAPQNNH